MIIERAMQRESGRDDVRSEVGDRRCVRRESAEAAFAIRRRIWTSGRVVAFLVAVACLVLIPWIGFLAATLPARYPAEHWNLTWVGFDLALLAGLAVTGIALIRTNALAATAGLVTATLLVVDTWFDVTTSATQGELGFSLALALLVELPMAAVLVVMSRRLGANGWPTEPVCPPHPVATDGSIKTSRVADRDLPGPR